MVRVVYYDEDGRRDQPGFRGGGEAWWVRDDTARAWDEHVGSFDLPEPLYVAIFQLGVIDELETLPHQFILGSYEEGILLNEGLPEASKILRRYAEGLDKSYEWEWSRGDDVSYRVRSDGVSLRRGLIQLADFVDEAARRGYNVQLWL